MFHPKATSANRWSNFLEGKHLHVFSLLHNRQYLIRHLSFSVSKESIIDVEAQVMKVAVPIDSCTQKNVELHISQIFLISAAKNQLPLLIEDASRPEKSDVIYKVLIEIAI